MFWSLEHRVAAVRFMHETGSVVATQRRFRIHFNVPRHGGIPSRKTILQWVSKLENSGSLLDVKHGPPKTITPENEARARQAFERSLHRSARKQARVLGLSRRSLGRILINLKFQPYKIQMTQKLFLPDRQLRVNFCNTMLNIFDDVQGLLLMTDKAHFHLGSTVNKQNIRYWAPNNPKRTIQQPLHSPKVTCWCGVGTFGIVGPFFFENETGVTETVNSARYVAMLQTYAIPELIRLGLDPTNLYFQQDGATAHTARNSMAFLRTEFMSVISRFGDIPWPPRSPDLSIPDFFLWGYLKQKVYTKSLRTLQVLKEALNKEIVTFYSELLDKIFARYRKRMNDCLVSMVANIDKLIYIK